MGFWPRTIFSPQNSSVNIVKCPKIAQIGPILTEFRPKSPKFLCPLLWPLLAICPLFLAIFTIFTDFCPDFFVWSKIKVGTDKYLATDLTSIFNLNVSCIQQSIHDMVTSQPNYRNHAIHLTCDFF